MAASIGDALQNPRARAEMQKAETPNATSIEKGVVIDVFDGFNSNELFAQMQGSDSSFRSDRIPLNSCVVRMVSQGADATASSFVLAMPFFSSHLSMPVKVGETVWVLFDRNVKSIGYWLSRVHGDMAAEDVNFSHYDRSYAPKVDAPTGPGTVEKANKDAESAPPTDDFPNLSLRQGKDADNTYDSIAQANISKSIKLEPVPRYIKRPGDLVLQGSNNATISLTTDRGWKAEDDPAAKVSNAVSGALDYSGTVDIVSGRSRWIKDGEIARTVPEIRENTRKFKETVKDPSLIKNPVRTEGDPDFSTDASRLYVTMRSNIDTNFSLTEQFPRYPGEEEAPPPLTDVAAIACKSDHVRIIARKDEQKQINGSILIVKEGDKQETNDNCTIHMRSDGSVLISGSRIIIGRTKPDGGIADGPDDAPDNLQPYVKYKQLEDLLKAVMADIKEFCDTVNTHTTPGYGAPSIQINQAVTKLKSAMTTREGEITKIRSERIFGE